MEKSFGQIWFASQLTLKSMSVPSIRCLHMTWPSYWLWMCFSASLVYPRVFQFVFMISNFASNELLCRRLRVSLVSDSWDLREWFSHAHRHIWGLIQSAVIIMITAHCSRPFGWFHASRIGLYKQGLYKTSCNCSIIAYSTAVLVSWACKISYFISQMGGSGFLGKRVFVNTITDKDGVGLRCCIINLNLASLGEMQHHQFFIEHCWLAPSCYILLADLYVFTVWGC